MATIQERIMKMLEDNGAKASELIQMDLTMRDKVIYAVNTTLTDYPLFSESTNTGKDSYSRTHKFPLQRGKVYTIHGIVCESNVEISATVPGTISTTPGYNKQLFESESFFEFKYEKTTLNPVYLKDTLKQNLVNLGTTFTAQPRQQFLAYYFGSPILVPFSGDIGLTFRPRTGLATAATAVTNPFYLNGTTPSEGFTITVSLIAQEWTIIQ